MSGQAWLKNIYILLPWCFPFRVFVLCLLLMMMWTHCEVPVEEYKSNLKEIVAHVRKVHPRSKLLLIAPPPIHEVSNRVCM